MLIEKSFVFNGFESRGNGLGRGWRMRLVAKVFWRNVEEYSI